MFPRANGKSEGVRGSYLRFPPWWESGYFLEIHIWEIGCKICCLPASIEIPD